MVSQVWTEQRPSQGLDGTVYILSAGGARAEVWPALGFNCYRWQVPSGADVLFAVDELFTEAVPTRSGIPVLFPFPNRIRDGRFRWDGRDYQLPLNDPAKKNAIHGFACRHPWRVIDHGSDAEAAWITGLFESVRDAPAAQALWPAAYRLTLTYRLTSTCLSWSARVDNPDSRPLPFGLGFHPYLRVDWAGADCRIEAPAATYWELEANLPTGRRLPVDAARDLNRPRRVSDLHLDDILTGLPTGAGPLVHRGSISNRVTLLASPAFRELVVFTPPHRRAVCLEPYTCTTDAVNLQAGGVDGGWAALPPGESWCGEAGLQWRDG